MRRTLGTAVFSGMLGVTLFGIFLTPVFFYVIQGVTDWQHRTHETERRGLPGDARFDSLAKFANRSNLAVRP